MNETFAELGYKVGDTVRCVDNKSCRFYTTGKKYVLEGSVDSRPTIKGDQNGFSATWELLSRAVSPVAADDKYPIWGDMKPEEQGALLLAKHNGKNIELFCHDKWVNVDDPIFYSDDKYRVKPAEPVVVTHELFGQQKSFWRGPQAKSDTHKMSYNTIDGVIDCASVKMLKLPQ